MGWSWSWSWSNQEPVWRCRLPVYVPTTRSIYIPRDENPSASGESMMAHDVTRWVR